MLPFSAALCSHSNASALLAGLVAPPCSEAELLQFADTDWKNPVKRTALVNRWQSEALARYKSVLAQIAAN